MTDLVVGIPFGACAPEFRSASFDAVAARSFQQLCQIVDYLHGQSLVHGNLVPDNLILESSGTLKLVDLGHCEDLTASERFWHPNGHGTPSYSSPEHFVGPLVPESDYFVVAVLLCEQLTGKHPFPAQSLPELLGSIHAGAARAVLPPGGSSGDLAASVGQLLDLDISVRREGWTRLRTALSKVVAP